MNTRPLLPGRGLGVGAQLDGGQEVLLGHGHVDLVLEGLIQHHGVGQHRGPGPVQTALLGATATEVAEVPTHNTAYIKEKTIIIDFQIIAIFCSI